QRPTLHSHTIVESERVRPGDRHLVQVVGTAEFAAVLEIGVASFLVMGFEPIRNLIMGDPLRSFTPSRSRSDRPQRLLRALFGRKNPSGPGEGAALPEGVVGEALTDMVMAGRVRVESVGQRKFGEVRLSVQFSSVPVVQVLVLGRTLTHDALQLPA